jgi:hypothetical protein
VGDRELETAALALVRKSAARPQRTCGVIDAGLCHGAAGLAHLFNRVHQASGDEALRSAARAWIGHTLDYRKPGQGSAGFLIYGPRPESPRELGWIADDSFLAGTAGIGLALLAAITPVEPRWDRVLGCAIAPRSSS